MKLDMDLHIHTYHSPCGWDEMIPADIVRVAIERDLSYIGILDHFYPFTNPSDLDEVRSAVRSALSCMADPPHVFLGVEAEVMAVGRTTATPELADKLDFIMLGATHFQNKGITDPLPEGTDREVAEYFVKMFEYAVGIPYADIIAHPFHVVPDVASVRILETLTEADVLPALELAKENNIAMEISHRALTPGQLEFARWFYPLCKRVGLKFTVGSDAHTLARIGYVDVLIPLLREIGLTEQDFWLPEPKNG